MKTTSGASSVIEKEKQKAGAGEGEVAHMRSMDLSGTGSRSLMRQGTA